MQKTFRSFLLCFSLLFFTHNLLASDLWVKTSGDIRHFVSLDTDEGIIVKHYVQEKGDYQDLISTNEFSTLLDAKKFIKQTYPQYHSTKKLSNWSINTTASDKKNSNLWVATNQWSDYWEERYAQWLQSEITSDFYMKYNIPTDCADALIGYRWIFARIYSLPVANTVSDTGSLFGQFSMRKQWENLPTSANWYDDQLFLAALNYVMDMTSTRTVMATDGFPVSVTRKGLQAGTFIVSQTNGSGHMRTITENYFDDPSQLPLFTHSSTAPREVRPLYREAFVDQAWPIRGTREILAFRWPVVSRNSWTLTPKQNDPRYSTEQFDQGLQGKYYSFIQFVISRVKPNYDPFSLIDTGIIDLVNYTNMRVKIVRDGYEFCRSHNCNPGTQGYEDWSTPNRDSKYVIKFAEIEDLVKAFDPMYPGLMQHWQDALDGTVLDIEGYSLSLARLRNIFEKKLASYNPKDSILRRWGLQ
ncbi:hypothetical protein DOM21_02230 [Bacteriovorax stolpii]|uniref:Uncharacterized protein n=1 Tax=Bacteriovorax stolpii TaxID=960 RepID=A0A2K9NW17_BACTC|nr:hypothetical protein [Bacteriovorax stolpii]AUN99712.1 hypothetical protein C0V70_16680 [Bacteriovorax stolpii]QDK40291.1 hypothetical protein DOM21_02230 [Bacteriovorax stolpii]TDP51345.1 hypothetical protein C8D79_3519 [Bacteriovorax stolpii]